MVGALKELKAGDLAENALKQFSKANGNVEEKDDMPAKVPVILVNFRFKLMYMYVDAYICTCIKIFGCLELPDYGINILQEEKPSIRTCDAVQNNLGRKRSGAEDGCDLEGNDDVSGKRARPTHSVSEELSQEHRPSTGSISNKGNSDSGPVQQLVAMFGALVAQGEKAVSSLEILISSISADLLAEVVMANMCNLPSYLPQAEVDEESVLNMSIIGSDTGAKYPASFLANVLSLSSSFPLVASLLHVHQPISSDIGVK